MKNIKLCFKIPPARTAGEAVLSGDCACRIEYSAEGLKGEKIRLLKEGSSLASKSSMIGRLGFSISLTTHSA